MKCVRAEIDRNGKVSLEFIGFQGEECTEERGRLQEALEALGVALDPERIRRKSSAEMATEVSTAERPRGEELGRRT
jgi:hypothetical protein